MLEGNKIPYNRVINLFYKRKIYEHIIKNVFSGSFWATELYMLSFPPSLLLDVSQDIEYSSLCIQ